MYEPLELVHCHVCFMKSILVGGSSHFVTFEDDVTMKNWFSCFCGKKDFFCAFDRVLLHISQCGRIVGSLRIDRGEKLMPILVEHCATHGIKREHVDLMESPHM